MPKSQTAVDNITSAMATGLQPSISSRWGLSRDGTRLDMEADANRTWGHQVNDSDSRVAAVPVRIERGQDDQEEIRA